MPATQDTNFSNHLDLENWCVTIGGLALIGLEPWWFIQQNQGQQTIAIKMKITTS